MSRLATLLEGRGPVMTVELPALNTADADSVLRAVDPLLPIADAINVSDNSAGRAHPSPVATAGLVVRAGGEPIMHLTCRDRNRLALESEILGGALLGVENVLCLTGDDVTAGDEPEAKRVFDLDAPQLLALARGLSRGHYLSGRRLERPPQLYLGASENPAAPPFAYRADRALKKVEAGASFFQLQIVFELDRLERFLERAHENGLARRAHLLATVSIARSADGLRFLRDKVPGVVVPGELIQRVDRLPGSAQPAECLETALEFAESALALPDIRGLHVVSFQPAEAATTLREVVDRSRRGPNAYETKGSSTTEAL